MINNNDLSPKYCPFCGSKNIYTYVALWDSKSLEEEDDNEAVLDEHQCQDCEGRSFWS